MNLFIDTNVWLSFYDFTSSDLSQLEKLMGYMELEKVRLLLPEQVVDEFDRNRENKFQNALKSIKSHKQPTFPVFCKDFSEYKTIKNAITTLDKARKSMLDKVEKQFHDRNLRADAVIDPIFQNSDKLPTTKKILNAARDRMTKGNPPRKKGNNSHGDAINWECL